MILLVIASVFLSAPAFATVVTTERTESTLISDVSAIHAGEKFWLVVHIKQQPGWHTYWKNPGDSGMASSLEWTLPKGFAAGDIQFLAPDRIQESDLVDYAYNDNAWLPVAVTAPMLVRANTIAIFAVKANWLVCKDVCIPETAEFSLSLPEVAGVEKTPSGDALVIGNVIGRLPVPLNESLKFQHMGDKITFSTPHPGIAAQSIKAALFFPATEGFIANNAGQQVSMQADKTDFTLVAEKGVLPEKVEGVVSFFLSDGARKDFSIALAPGKVANLNGDGMGSIMDSSAGNISLAAAVAFAFLGGLILNLMPCVFPILALKALAIVRKAEKRASQVRMHGLVYSIGVVASFLALASVLIAIQLSGKSIGWGYQMQSPMFVLGLAVIVFLVGLNLSGYFELPSLFGNVGSGVAAKDSLVGSFATGVLAVMVATPCTAPFMAPAIGFALTQSIEVVLVVFASLGFGLAAPFLLLSMFPKLIKLLPKPGAWMLGFKQAVAFPMYGCTVWLLWILAREAGEDALFVVMSGFVALAFAVWLIRMRAKYTGLLLAVLVIAGMAEFMHFTHNANSTIMTSEAFSPARLQALRDEGKPVFVDATADWCITCKVNEHTALSSKEIRKLFEQKHIIYMVADWTHDDKDITAYLQSFGRAGVPIYVYYPPDHGAPVVLPQVLTKAIVEDAVK